MTFDSEKYERAIKLIRYLEWSGTASNEDPCCPECGAVWLQYEKEPEPHTFNCRMVEFLVEPSETSLSNGDS